MTCDLQVKNICGRVGDYKPPEVWNFFNPDQTPLDITGDLFYIDVMLYGSSTGHYKVGDGLVITAPNTLTWEFGDELTLRYGDHTAALKRVTGGRPQTIQQINFKIEKQLVKDA